MPPVSRPTRRWLLRGAGTAALAASTIAALGGGAASASAPKLTSQNLGAFSATLSSSGTSLYVLSTEKGGVLHCTSKACLTAWHPLEVATSVKSVAVGAGVKGKVGFVKRTSSLKQVTYNSFPLYTFSGDTSKSKTNGEALSQFGGRFYLVHALSTKTTTTEFIPLIQSATIAGKKNAIQVGSNALSLYLLTSEQGGTITCTGQCLSAWPPLYVANGTTAITVGGDVKGKIGFITDAGRRQVTYNSFPIYTYYTDTAGTDQGEGIQADGGTWYLVSAPATTASTSPVK